MTLRVPVGRLVVALVGLGLPQPAPSAWGQFLRLSTEQEWIRDAPRPTGNIVTAALRGDVFEITGTRGDWYQIRLLSDADRYLPRSAGELVPDPPALGTDTLALQRACREITRLEDWAAAESRRQRPEDLGQRLDREWFLRDRYGLAVYRKYGIAAALHTTLGGECDRHKWRPMDPGRRT